MGVETKPRRAWVYLSEGDDARVQKLLELTSNMNEATLLSTLLRAALGACEKNGFNSIPVKLIYPSDGPNDIPAPPPKKRP